MDAISLLKKDHTALRHLLTELAQSPPRAEQARGDLVQRICRLMRVHGWREDTTPAVIRNVPAAGNGKPLRGAALERRSGLDPALREPFRSEPQERHAAAGGAREQLSLSARAQLRARMDDLKRQLLAVAAGAEPEVESRPAPPLPAERSPEEIAPAFVSFPSNADSRPATGEILALLGGEKRAG